MLEHFPNNRAFIISRYELEERENPKYAIDFLKYCYAQFCNLIKHKCYGGCDLVLMWEEDYKELYENYQKDKYHTISELYNHRHALFCALVKIYDNYITPFNTKVSCWKSKLHSDNTMFEDSFIVGMTIRNFDATVSYITYHLPLDWWDKFNVIELKNAPEYDGYSSNDVIERLMRL